MVKNNKDLHTKSVNLGEKVLGENLSFAASEAYKLLRTNLTFSSPLKRSAVSSALPVL